MTTRAKRLIVVRFRADRGRWELDYRDQHRTRHRPLFESEAEALEEAAKKRKDLEQGIPLLDDPDLTVRGYAERWLAGGSTQELEPKTRESYRQLLDSHVLPILGHLKLRELHRRHVKALVAAKRAARLPRKTTKDVARADAEASPSGRWTSTSRTRPCKSSEPRRTPARSRTRRPTRSGPWTSPRTSPRRSSGT